MINKKILILSTYPIKNPRHGGQKRTKAIFDIYKANYKKVINSAVFYRGFYENFDKYDIPLSFESEQLVLQSPLTGDIVCGEAIYNDIKIKKKMVKLLKTLNPDIIHIEQPFPYLGLKPLLKELNLNPKIIFGSQNIEAPMKREILESFKVSNLIIKKYEQIISDLEHDLSSTSDLVVACTDSDLREHLRMGAKKVVLAPNGINLINANHYSIDYWKNKFYNLGIKRTILFVGSAHPPNWTGYLKMVGKSLGFIPTDTRLIIGGSVSDYFENEINSKGFNIEDVTFWLRAFSAGRLSEERLCGLIYLSDIIILPITDGGGSNLKTAEAIIANKKVVTTSHALRSFEWFRNFPNVWVADDQETFIKSIKVALDAPFKTRSKTQEKLVSSVEWINCLSDMIKMIKDL